MGGWFRALFNDSPTGLVVIGLDGTILAANGALRALGNYPSLRRPQYLTEFVPTEQRAVIEHFFRTARVGEPVDFDTSLLCADGTLVPVGATLFPLHRHGRIVAIGGRVRDHSLMRLGEQWLLETEQRFRSLFDYHPDAVALVDRTEAVVLANVAASATSGYALEELALRPISALFAPDHREALEQRLAETFEGRTSEFESMIVDRDGLRREVLIKTVPVYVDREVAGAYVIAKDVSAQKAAERDALEQSGRVRALYLVAASTGRSTTEQIQATLELGNRLLGCNGAFLSELEDDELVVRYAEGQGVTHGVGYRSPLAHTHLRDVLGEDDVVAVDDVREQPRSAEAKAEEAGWTAFIATPIEVFGKLRGAIAFASTLEGGRKFRESDKDLVRLMGALCGSALERLAHETRLGALAFYDALTGLPNRVLFDDRVAQTFMAARRHHQKFAILYLDIDHFKEVNDVHGHPGGDELLRVVAHRLLAVARESDTVARQGGDEFVILQRFVRSSQDAMRLARRINEALRQPVTVNDATVVVSASIGVALYPDDGVSSEELLLRSDAALYRAKALGRDRAVLCESLGPVES